LKLYVNVKQAAARKNYITREEINLAFRPENLRQLIAELVKQRAEDFNKRNKAEDIIKYLTDGEIEDRVVVGKVSFGEKYNKTPVETHKATEAAFLAYEDGIYRVFIGDREAGDLDEPLELKEEEVLTFVRLTMLSGRMW
jgi:hypothetical protein